MSVAIVTGGSSGMGLALVKNLLARKYAHVVIADLAPPTEDSVASLLDSTVSFFKTDVTSWDNQSALFKSTFEKFGHIDVVALNAGIAETDSIFAEDNDGPVPLNLKTVTVDLDAQIMGFRLALWYMRRNPGEAGGKIIFTASSAGFYSFPASPIYCAAKHGVVGFARSVAPIAKKDNILVNAVCPGLVRTPIVDANVTAAFPNEHWTPVPTIMRGFDLFLDTDRYGEMAECSGDQVVDRKDNEYLDEHMEFLFGKSYDLFLNASKKSQGK
ncbi:hypothetical protein BZA70DRAFT_175132 [Myxozyma melibiosi]|uniref:NAD(P)-binding protein n=1 Tax=Myxozyma melibiosi TaxID=54550 RepID=A0ABR1F5P0_9ASCO